MHLGIVKEAFEKTKEIIEKRDGVKISNTKASEYLSETLQYEYEVPFSDKSLRDVCNGKTSIKQAKVLNALCKFLEYDNYADYIDKNSLPSKEMLVENKLVFFVKKHKVKFIIGSLFVVILVIFFLSAKKQRWMVWNKDHYEEVIFDTEKYNIGQLKLYKEERILFFKKLEATCEVEYFDKSGKPKIWYGKNSKKELEIFTSYGLHPETGKTLKPISKYMIKKYFCNDYEK